MNCAIEPNQEKTAWRLNSQSAFRLLLLLIWANNTIVGFVIEIIDRLPLVGMLSPYIMPCIYIFLAICAAPYILKCCRPGDLIFYVMCAVTVLLTMLIYPDNTAYISPQLVRILCTVFPLYFIGIAYRHELHKDDLFWVSLLGVLAVFAYQLYYLYTGRVLSQDNMEAAYNVLPSVMYLIYSAFEKKKVRYVFPVIAGFFLMFLFGTRGALLAALLFGAICLFFYKFKGCKTGSKLVFLLIAGGVLVCLFATEVLTELARLGSQSFERWGFSTRIFDFFLEGEFVESKGREYLYRVTLEAIQRRPLLGYGIMGDQVCTGGSYAHNLFLEFWCQFGIFVGSALALLLISFVIKALYHARKNAGVLFVLLFVCLVFVKLMISGSYLYESWLYFLIGLSTASLRRRFE